MGRPAAAGRTEELSGGATASGGSSGTGGSPGSGGGLDDGPPAGPEGVIPNEPYPESVASPSKANWQDGLISPTLESEHHNQPAVINGYLQITGNSMFSLYDISIRATPTCSTSESPDYCTARCEAEGHEVSFAKYGDRLLTVTIQGKGVDFWDITDARNPEHLKTVYIDGINYGDLHRGRVGRCRGRAGTFSSVGRTPASTSSTPASPRTQSLVGHLTNLAGVSAGPLFPVGNVLVVTTPKDNAGIATLDISNPENPILLKSVLPAEKSYIGAFYRHHAYLLNPLRVYDVLSNPTEISLVSGTRPGGYFEYLSFQDDRAFGGRIRPEPGATKIDVSNLSNFTFVKDIYGRRDLQENDDQFTVAIGNLLVLSDDQPSPATNQYAGTVIAVHDTDPDTTPPVVDTIIPKDGATGQATTSRIGISFTDNIELATVDHRSFIVRQQGERRYPASGREHDHPAFRARRGLRSGHHLRGGASRRRDQGLGRQRPCGRVQLYLHHAMIDFRRLTLFGVSAFCAFYGRHAQALEIELEVPAPTLDGTTATFSADVADASGAASLRWDFGDGTVTEFSPDATSAEHLYASPGHYSVTVVAQDDGGFASASFVHTVHTAPLATRAQTSSPLLLDAERGLIVTANTDSGTVSLVDLETLEKVDELEVFDDPVALALAPDGLLWVLHRETYAILLVNLDERRAVDFFRLPYASQPAGLVFSPAGDAYVTSMALGEVLRIDGETHEVTAREYVAPSLRGITMSGDGTSLWVTRFISQGDHGEVHLLDSETLTAITRYDLIEDTTTEDSDVQGRGLPNYLFSVTVSPDGRRAWVPSKKDNMARGLERDGLDLPQDSAVRPLISALDLELGEEVFSERIDLDDRNLPVEVSLSPLGDWAFISVFGSNLVDVRDAFDGSFLTALRANSLFGPRSQRLPRQWSPLRARRASVARSSSSTWRTFDRPRSNDPRPQRGAPRSKRAALARSAARQAHFRKCRGQAHGR